MNVQQTGIVPSNVLPLDEAVEKNKPASKDVSLQGQARGALTVLDRRRKSLAEMKLRSDFNQSTSASDDVTSQNGSKLAQPVQINSVPVALNDVAGVMTKARLDQMTPTQALHILKQGNARFVSGQIQQRDTMYRVKTTAQVGQAPFAHIVSCIDSRVNPLQVFDQGVGDLFSSRVAGNMVNGDTLGDLEFSSKIIGTKLIMVLGHTDCGAVKGAVDTVNGLKPVGENLGNLAQLLNKITPVVKQTPNPDSKERSSNNPQFVQAIAKNNANRTVKMIYDQSPVLREMVKKGEIKIVNAMYHVETGKVEFDGDTSQA